MPSASRNESQRSGEATQGGRATESSGGQTRQRAGPARTDSAGRLKGNQRPARPETWIKALARPLFREAFLFARDSASQAHPTTGDRRSRLTPTTPALFPCSLPGCSFVDRVDKRLATFPRLRHTPVSFSTRSRSDTGARDSPQSRGNPRFRAADLEAWGVRIRAGKLLFIAPAHPPRAGGTRPGTERRPASVPSFFASATLHRATLTPVQCPYANR